MTTQRPIITELLDEIDRLKAEASRAKVATEVKATQPTTFEEACAMYSQIDDPKDRAEFRERHAVLLQLRKA